MFPPAAIRREKFKQRRVAEILFEISALAQVFGIDFRHWQAMPAKMPRKFKERDVLFAHVIENANGADRGSRCGGGKADDLAAGAAQLTLQRLDPIRGKVKMPLEQLAQNIHGNNGDDEIKIPSNEEWATRSRTERLVSSLRAGTARPIEPEHRTDFGGSGARLEFSFAQATFMALSRLTV